MRLMLVFAGVVLLTLSMISPSPAAAATEVCSTTIGGEPIELSYDPENRTLDKNTGLRERFFGGYGAITCPGYVTLRHLTPDLREVERKPFCLRYDKESRSYLGYDQGERDAYLTCKEPSKTLCERVNGSKEVAVDVAERGIKAAGTASDVVWAVQQGSGAVILSGTGGQVAGALASLGTTAMAAFTAPATLTAAAVSVVAVGGAVYVCR